MMSWSESEQLSGSALEAEKCWGWTLPLFSRTMLLNALDSEVLFEGSFLLWH